MVKTKGAIHLPFKCSLLNLKSELNKESLYLFGSHPPSAVPESQRHDGTSFKIHEDFAGVAAKSVHRKIKIFGRYCQVEKCSSWTCSTLNLEKSQTIQI